MPNRLAGEVSPYLRQHANNPVDWYPWGGEAFERACADDRPVLLSVGYAACHWCHVMAHESFEDPDLAGYLNAHFVSVKVDREEHPDVDALYQGICQAVTGQGGWPLTVFLTPDRRPFHVGTYFPPRARYGRPGFRDVLAAVSRAWRDDRPRLLEVAGEWTSALRQLHAAGAAPGEAPDRGTLRRAAAALAAQVDPMHGGFGDAPKFPQAPALEALLRAGGQAAERAVFTLRAMAAGGIRDQLGGGFHRYSVDASWTVPHFEKMVYDNAVLVPLYLLAFQRTRDRELADVARQTLEYMASDLAAPGGGFCSSEDADSPASDGHPAEGAFYTWTPEEVEAALGDAGRARAACDHFGVTPAGSFEDGRSVLRLGAIALPAAEAEAAAAALRRARAQRPRPARDEKVLAGWNGLAISAFARASRILGEPRYADVARETARFILGHLRADGVLLRRHPAGPRPVPAVLEDYAGLASGLLDLYEATFEPAWLGEAATLSREAVRRFWDPGAAAFHLGAEDAGLPARPRDDGDGPVAAAQSAAAMCLARLRPYLRDAACADIPAAILQRCAGSLRRHPLGLGSLLSLLDQVTDPLEVVLAVPGTAPVPPDWLEGLAARPLPNLLLSRLAGSVPGLEHLPPVWEGREPVGGRPTVWVCRGEACAPPAHAWDELAPLLDGAGRTEPKAGEGPGAGGR